MKHQPYQQHKRFDWGNTIPFMGESVPGGRPGIDTTGKYSPRTDAAAMDAEVMAFEEWRDNWCLPEQAESMQE